MFSPVLKNYRKKCNIISSLITSEFPDLKFSLLYNENTGLNELYFPEKKTNISIIEPINWKSLKRGINIKINGLIDMKCNICTEKMNKTTSCSKCYKKLVGCESNDSSKKYSK